MEEGEARTLQVVACITNGGRVRDQRHESLYFIKDTKGILRVCDAPRLSAYLFLFNPILVPNLKLTGI